MDNQNDLEAQVEARVAELKMANQQLQQKLAEHEAVQARLRRLAEQHKRLLEVSQSILAVMTPDEVISQVEDALHELISYDTGAFLWLDKEAGILQTSHIVGKELLSDTPGKWTFPLDSGISGAVAQSGKAELVNNSHLDPRSVYPANAKDIESEHLICVPARVEDETFGVLVTGRINGEPFTTEEFELVQLFTAQVTIAAKNARLYEQAQQEIAERKQAEKRNQEVEDQLRHSQKMEAVGQLAGGIAHDFNNLLTGIMGYSGFALDTLSPEHPVYGDIENIQRSAQRAATLTRQLLTFARKQIINPIIVNLNDMIVNMDGMLRRLIREDIELLTLPDPNLAQVKVDPHQMEQVLVNLVVNARDAMPDGGKLIIETANVILDQEYIGRHAEVIPGQYIMLAVTDTGVGISKEVMPHIFEPFYTTKEVGQGTGLGLATCFGIVKQNRGHIWVYSEPNQGTTFKVYLPAAKVAANAHSGQYFPGQYPQGTETVLVVEDEAVVRTLAVRTLRNLGYTILEATDGAAGLDLARTYGIDQIHLLMTDVIMPIMGGKDLAEHLKVANPDLKILFVSGYPGSAIVRKGILELGDAYLQKPFPPEVLARKVREVLDETGSAWQLSIP